MKGWRRSKRPSSPQQPSLPGLSAPLLKTRRLATPHEQALDVARARLIAAVFVFALAYLVIAGRLADLTLFGNTPEPSLAQETASDGVVARADITDRNGVALATSLPTTSLCVDAKRILNPEDARKKLLSALPDLDPKKLDEAMQSG